MKRRQNGHTLTLGVAAVCAIGLNLQGTATAQVHYSYAHAPVTEKKGSTTVTEWRDALGRNPTTQVTQQHTTKDGKEVKTSSWDSLSGGGSSQPGAGEDEETQRVDDKTIRTVRRLFGTDANGNRKVIGITEEESRTLPGGGESLVRTVSQPDLNGGFQPIRREVEETKPTSSGASESRTTILRPGIEERLVPSEQIIKVDQKQGDLQKVQTKRLLPDSNGRWQITNQEDKVIKAQSKNARAEQDRVYQRDAQQNLSLAKEVVTRNWKDAAGQEHETVETYLTNTPGTTIPGDGHLNLDQRLRVVRRVSADGTQRMEQQQEEHDPNAPFNGFRVAQKTLEIASSDRSGNVKRQGSVEAFDGNGNTRVIRVFSSRQIRE